MDKIDSVVYADLYQVLNTYAFFYDRIPKDIIRFIKKNASKKYVVRVPNGENILNYISKEALELYTALYLEYAASEAQKKELKGILVNNDMTFRKLVEG